MSYSEYKHRHNFAVWAAARAAQRGFTNIQMLQNAIEQCGIEAFVQCPSKESEFKTRHKNWCNSICDYLNIHGVSNVSYGRAAKLVNVYLKGMVVLIDPYGEPAKFIHPPIDRILLQNIAKNFNLDRQVEKKLKTTNWTQLDEKDYFVLIDRLRLINGSRPFWQLEEYWTITNQ